MGADDSAAKGGFAVRIGVIGLGYVGLPLAVAFADVFEGTVGFDINGAKVKELREGVDRTGEVSGDLLKKSSLRITCDL